MLGKGDVRGCSATLPSHDDVEKWSSREDWERDIWIKKSLRDEAPCGVQGDHGGNRLKAGEQGASGRGYR